jgi:hypothetical membrane protein
VSIQEEQLTSNLPIYTGLVIPVWLFIGVIIAAAMNPDYNHIDQAMSELGAVGSPTHTISPIINNFSLRILFVIFGVSVIRIFHHSKLALTSGVFIMLNGIGSIGPEYFSCGAGCNPESLSISQTMHNLSGAVMFLFITMANCIWVFLGAKLLKSSCLSWFSLVRILVALAVVPALPFAIESGQDFGLYQRVNYGASVIWMAGLAYVLLKYQTKSS